VKAQPRPGLTIPVQWLRVIDADTIVVTSTLTGRKIRVRLSGCDAPERHSDDGIAATRWVESYLEEYAVGGMLLHLPLPEDKDGSGVIDMAELLQHYVSFERVVGELWVGGYSLAESLILRGYADGSR